MDFFTPTVSVPILAVVLDAVIGDPHTFPHPVRYIGNALDLFEVFVRKTGLNLRLSGWAALVLFSGSAWAIVTFLMTIPMVGFLFTVYFAYAGLALGCLLKESRKVATLVDRGDLSEARKAIAMLVSRDTSKLDEEELRRTLAETVSENLNDGFVAPMFFLLLFGPGGMWAYKTVSTMDSMWGYKTEKYRELGFAGAKMDDFLAYIPARLTSLTMVIVGKFISHVRTVSMQDISRDAGKMDSPNAGWPMAAAAWLIGGQMGGPTIYFGKVKEKPILGPKGQPWTGEMVHHLIVLCRYSGYCSAGLLLVASLILTVR